MYDILCKNRSRAVFLLMLFMFSLFSNAGFASSLLIQTNSQTELRASPNGNVIGTLGPGVVGIVRDYSPPWLKIYFGDILGANSAKEAWVNISNIHVLKTMVSGDDCETDYDTDAEVCVTLDDASLDCDKNYEGYFSSCEVEIDYTVETDLENDNKYLDVEVEFEAEISYERQDGFGSYDSEDDDESHTLYSSGSETGEIELDFDFSYYEQVYSVRIDDAECEIDSVYSY